MWSFYLKPQHVGLFHASTSKARVHAPHFKRALTNKCGCMDLAEIVKGLDTVLGTPGWRDWGYCFEEEEKYNSQV